MNVGEYLKSIREEKGLTQSEISGFSKSYVSQVENGKRNLTIESLKAYANALGMELNPTLFIEKK